jgi:hypothetical protein
MKRVRSVRKGTGRRRNRRLRQELSCLRTNRCGRRAGDHPGRRRDSPVPGRRGAHRERSMPHSVMALKQSTSWNAARQAGSTRTSDGTNTAADLPSAKVDAHSENLQTPSQEKSTGNRSDNPAVPLRLTMRRRIERNVYSSDVSSHARNVLHGLRRIQLAFGTFDGTDTRTGRQHDGEYCRRRVNPDHDGVRSEPADSRCWDDNQLAQRRQHHPHV